MKYILYFLGMIGTYILAVIFLPSPYDTNTAILIFCIVLWCIPIFIRLIKYLFLMLKTKRILKKKEYKTTKFCYFPLSSKFHGKYSMSFKNNDKTMNIVFISKKLKYKNYYFENVNLVRFFSYNRVMIYKGNGAGRHGSHVSNTNIIQRKDFGKQNIIWPLNINDKQTSNFILFDKWPENISDFTKHDNISLGQGDYICNSNIQIYDFTTFSKFLENI